jgi:RNA methyltransferase, TrmH family
MRRVSSRQNPVVARFRELARRRGAGDRVLLEGEHLVTEALASGIAIDTVAIAERRLETAAAARLAERVERAGGDALRVSDPVMAALSPTREPSGIVAIARLAPSSLDDTVGASPQLLVVLAGVQDAGNVGAIVRAADGCGATGIVTTDGTADPFGWKALRGAMGSTFRVPVAVQQPLASTLDTLKRHRIAIVAAVPRGGTALQNAQLHRPLAIVLGAEGAGLPDEIAKAASERVTIPMRPPVESFNVAITAALILYEAARQRSLGPEEPSR